MKRFLVAVVVCAAAACGGKTGNDDGGGHFEDLSTQPSDDLAGGPDLANGSDLAGLGGGENEPPNIRTNDGEGVAVPLALGQSIDGTIGDVQSGQYDVDYFKITAQAGDVLRVTLTPRGDYQGWAYVEQNQGQGYLRVARANGAGATTRQLYIPADGDYYVVVSDERNELEAQKATPDPSKYVGGASYTYTLKVEKQTVTPTAATLPIAAQAGTISSDEAVQIFSADFTAASEYILAIKATKLATPSDVDPHVILMDASAAAPVLVDENDDISYPDNVDSLLRVTPTTTGKYHVVVDFFEVKGANHAFELSAGLRDKTVELEPNDTVATANPIDAPVGTATTTVKGTIDRTASGAQNGDLDVFELVAAAGDSFEIVVTPGSSAPTVPYVAWQDTNDYTTFSNPNRPKNTPVRLEVYAFTAGAHHILVGDVNNLTAAAGGYVGGATYTYTVTVTRFTRTVAPLGSAPVLSAAQAAINQGGKTAWFTFDVAAGAPAKAAIDLDVSAVSTVNGFALQPFLALIDTDGVTELASGNQLALAERVLPAGTYTLRVSDAYGAFSATGHGLKPRVALTTLTAVTDDGSHTAIGAALAVPALAVVDSTLPMGGAVYYDLGTVAAGTALRAETMSPPAGGTVDTLLTLVDGSGTTVNDANGTPISDDDGGTGTFSLIDSVVIPTGGHYYLKCSGGVASAMGAYRVTIDLTGCGTPAAATSRIWVNEILSAPATQPGGELVELVNGGRTAVDVGGLLLRDGSGVRWRAACGTTIAAGQALVVNGACATLGCQQANVDPAAPHSGAAAADELGLDDAGERVTLLTPAGATLDDVVVGAATANVSFARGAGGTCDQPPVGSAVQLHTACTGAAGNSSPGTRADGSAFPPPATLTNDTCTMATALALNQSLVGDTTGFMDNYDIGAGGACSAIGFNYPAPDAAYTVVVPAGKTVTVTVQPIGWDAAVAFSTDCATIQNSCIAIADDNGAGGAETLRWANATANPVTLQVIVDGYQATEYGEFGISATTN